MTGLIAVAGFWIFCIVAMVKFFDLRQRRALGFKEVESLKLRIADLEQQMNIANTQLLEFRDDHEFAMKLLKDSQKEKQRV